MTRFERKVAKAFEGHGYTILTKGWPDFLCYKLLPNGKFDVVAVEVKSETDYLRPHQQHLLEVLDKAMQVRHVEEGIGFGDRFNRTDMCVLHIGPKVFDPEILFKMEMSAKNG
jgi:hypothetical protein